MVDKTPVPDPIDIDKPLTDSSRRTMRRARRQAEKEEPKSEASAFSDAFAWANLKFDKAFVLKENTCAHKYLSDFWATTGTFITALLSSGAFRTILDYFTRRIFHLVSGETPNEPVKGMEAGAHEMHIIKTSHLGLCQAMGTLLCVAKYSGCPCGWLSQALWSMAIIWLFCVPIGTMVCIYTHSCTLTHARTHACTYGANDLYRQ